MDMFNGCMAGDCMADGGTPSHSPFTDEPNPHHFNQGIMSLQNEGAYAVMGDIAALEAAGHEIINFGVQRTHPVRVWVAALLIPAPQQSQTGTHVQLSNLSCRSV